ncbi:MAG: sigma-54-dependent Fis family transcriptional regulator [Hyphomicrobiales bacterium]|nr:MAG: sigma-54-dependent Fis family transcriptional regulator [Hyphomicrobiales bacterium]
MASDKQNVLIIEDVESLLRMYVSFLARDELKVDTATTGTAALAALKSSVPDVVVLDINLPDVYGLDILRDIKRQQMPTEVVVITSNGSVNLAVSAMREGAFDFIVKPFTADRLRITVKNALERRSLKKVVETLQDEFGHNEFCGFVGRSPAMQAVYRIIQNAAASKATVFITGESGTGKEVCAEALHKLSNRAKGPFVALNCAAIPHDLIESELFGHVKGAFTGATTDRQGAALRANGGTLFLDEIGELRIDFQAKLLRFIQSGEVQRVGEEKTRPVDVRIICATNRDPRAEVAAGRFREDLFYRLHVIPIELPALRARDDDVLLLATHFLSRYAAEDGKTFTGIDVDVEEAMLRHAWPGNVRELQNVIRQIVVLTTGPRVTSAMLPQEFHAKGQLDVAAAEACPAPVDPFALAGSGNTDLKIKPLEDVITAAVHSAIEQCQGSIPRAAAALKISPSTIYRRLQSKQSG